MKELVYPAILYKDVETGGYTIKIPDLGIVTDGANAVDAYIRAKEFLCATIDCAIKFDCEIESPTDIEVIWKKVDTDNKKNKSNDKVTMVDALA